MEGDEEEDEDEEEVETGTAPKIKQKSKTEKAPPKKKGRQSKKKEYVIPENKMVSIGALRTPKDAFVIMDISDTKNTFWQRSGKFNADLYDDVDHSLRMYCASIFF